MNHSLLRQSGPQTAPKEISSKSKAIPKKFSLHTPNYCSLDLICVDYKANNLTGFMTKFIMLICAITFEPRINKMTAVRQVLMQDLCSTPRIKAEILHLHLN